MATTFQLVDADSLAVLLDLNDSTGANNASFGSVKTRLKETFNLSSPTGNPVFFEPPASPGGSLVFKQDELVTSQVNVRLEATSKDNLHLFAGELQRQLRAGCVIKWIPEGSTETYYIDVAYGFAESLYRGQDLAQHAWRDGQMPGGAYVDVSGLGLLLTRQPTVRGAELDSDTNKLTNAGLFWVGATANRPGGWAWLVTTNITAEAIPATSGGTGPLPNWPAGAFYQFAIATTSARSLQQTTAVASFASGDVVTLSFYVKASAASILRARAAVQFKQSDGTTNVGSEFAGTLTAIGTDWTRVSVTTTAAGALTSRALVSLRFENVAATSVTAYLTGAQVEVGSTPSKYRPGTATVSNDPASTANQGRAFGFYVHGDAPPEATVFLTPSETASTGTELARLTGDDAVVYLNTRKFVQAESGTLGASTTSTVKAGSSGGSVARVSSAISATVATRSKTQITTNVDALVGAFKVYASLSSNTSEYEVRLAWRLSTGAGITQNINDSITRFIEVQPSEYDLGNVYIPEGAAALELDVQVGDPSGATGDLDIDYLFLIPLEWFAFFRSRTGSVVPGAFRVGDGEAWFVDSSGVKHTRLEAKGPTSGVLVPGLNVLVTVDFQDAVLSGADGPEGEVDIADTTTVRVTYAPRYYV